MIFGVCVAVWTVGLTSGIVLTRLYYMRAKKHQLDYEARQAAKHGPDGGAYRNGGGDRPLPRPTPTPTHRQGLSVLPPRPAPTRIPSGGCVVWK